MALLPFNLQQTQDAIPGQVAGLLNIAGTVVDLASLRQGYITTANNSPPGISGFVFSIPSTDQIQFQSQITDHVLQDNFTIQDHIALQPLRVTMTGIICELVWEKSSARDIQYAIQVINRLQSVNILMPRLAQKANSAIATYNSVKQQVEQGFKTFNSLDALYNGKQPSPSKQQQAYTKLKDMWLGRDLCTVVTPWENFGNMAIESLSLEQAEDTRDQTTISVTFKQIQFAQVVVSDVQLEGRIKAQKAPAVNQGKQQGKTIGAIALDYVTGAGAVAK